jgi:hypothetical protein
MAWTHIRLVHMDTGLPLAADWSPLVQDEEITAANQALEARHLPWRWICPDSPTTHPPCNASAQPSSP